MLQRPDSEGTASGERSKGWFTPITGFQLMADLLKSKVVKGELRSPSIGMQSVKTILDLPFKDYYGFGRQSV